MEPNNPGVVELLVVVLPNKGVDAVDPNAEGAPNILVEGAAGAPKVDVVVGGVTPNGDAVVVEEAFDPNIPPPPNGLVLVVVVVDPPNMDGCVVVVVGVGLPNAKEVGALPKADGAVPNVVDPPNVVGACCCCTLLPKPLLALPNPPPNGDGAPKVGAAPKVEDAPPPNGVVLVDPNALVPVAGRPNAFELPNAGVVVEEDEEPNAGVVVGGDPNMILLFLFFYSNTKIENADEK